VIRINELEYVGGSIYANVWLTDTIVRIDRNTGNVFELIEAKDLLTPEQRAAAGDEAVLNGIAYNPDHDTFYLTGKLWPSLFEVKFVQP
jgi:glutaminyl-peptide cyclotransferase